MTKKLATENTGATDKKNESTAAELEYDRLNKLFKAETDPVKRAELHEQCQKALEAKKQQKR